MNHVTSGNLSNYVEFWAKGGVGLFKNLSYELIESYNSNFVWLKYYESTELFGKLFFTIKVAIVCLLISFIVFNKFKFKKFKNLKINYIYITNLITLILIFYIWFNYHPQLRYGGYLICFLLGAKIIIPIINIFIESKKNNVKLLKLFVYPYLVSR